MEMCAAGATGQTHLTDHLPRTHPLVFMQSLTTQVTVNVVVITRGDHHSDATGVIVDRFDHRSVPPAQNRGAQGSRNIQTVMGAKGAVSPSPHPEMTGVSVEDRNRKSTFAPSIRSGWRSCRQTSR